MRSREHFGSVRKSEQLRDVASGVGLASTKCMLDIDTGLGAQGASGLLLELEIGTVIGAGSALQRYEVATLPVVIAST